MNDNKLKIRIQLQQPQQAIEQIYPDLPEPEMKYEQSLDRKKIFIVGLLLLATLALIGYLIFGANKQEGRLDEAGPVSDQPLSAQENKIPAEETILEREITEMPKSSSPIAQPKPAAIVNKPPVIPRKKPQVAAPPSQSKSEKILDHSQLLAATRNFTLTNTKTYREI